ncbi:MAG: hypothetical protein COB67_06565 [SAR324 cluster bacterium]|uniref:Tetratricopeptide repeat protein n=1 Tax=SAR324 cluster bacterium TaxID=2024889 RepID=A0A2A4T512_9DELT|nr:MAG: hypothetical protein COB67_06565 [SAR324 cluster bacterium]
MFDYQEKPNASPRLVQYFNKLGHDWEQAGKLREATGYYRKANAISLEVYGSEHRLTKSLSAKVNILLMQQKQKQAG